MNANYKKYEINVKTMDNHEKRVYFREIKFLTYFPSAVNFRKHASVASCAT